MSIKSIISTCSLFVLSLGCASISGTTKWQSAIPPKTTISQIDSSILKSFNSQQYGVTLNYLEGKYVLSPDIILPANLLDSIFEGKEWTDTLMGYVDLTGLVLKEFEGGGKIDMKVVNSVAYITTSVPFEGTKHRTDKVSYKDNTIAIGGLQFIIIAAEKDKLIYYRLTNYNHYWLYGYLMCAHTTSQ